MMTWNLLGTQEYQTVRWSGGTTTQLWIEPPQAAYASRDFLWRVSTATVEEEHSVFTDLPDYHRLLSVRKGELQLKVGPERPETMKPLQICCFDGAARTESWGRCTDFNLMLRKERCVGSLEAVTLPQGASLVWTPPQPACPKRTLIVFCSAGEVCLTQAQKTARAGELLICQDPGDQAVCLCAPREATVFLAAVDETE